MEWEDDRKKFNSTDNVDSIECFHGLIDGRVDGIFSPRIHFDRKHFDVAIVFLLQMLPRPSHGFGSNVA